MIDTAATGRGGPASLASPASASSFAFDSAAAVPLDWGPLLQTHPLAHFVYDPRTLALLEGNDAALQRYGFSRDEFLALNLADLQSPGPRGPGSNPPEGRSDSTSQVRPLVRIERHRDGRLLRGEVHAMPVMFRAQPAHLAVVLEANWHERLSTLAAEAERRQAEFMARASHEFRTPLNAILGFGQLMEEDPALAGSRAAAYASHVVKAGRHLLSLVEDLLALQSLDCEGHPKPTARVELAHLLRSCAESLRPLAEETGSQLVIAAPPMVAVRSDEVGLRQVLLHLLRNALRHGCAPGMGGRVCLTVEPDQGQVRLTVADQGPGMTEAELERFFEPFERLRVETGPPASSGNGSANGGGNGLGLLITRRLVRRLGCEVQIHSRPGAGTTAILHLPLATSDDSRSAFA